jgi:hypothetical protein
VSIVAIKEIPIGRDGAQEGISNAQTKRAWRIEVDSPSDNAYTIEVAGVASGDLPAYLALLPGSTNLTRRKLAIKQQSAWKWWIGEAEYSSVPISSFDLSAQAFQNPLDRPVQASGSSRLEKAIPIRGYKVTPGTGAIATTLTAILNSAGDEYDSRPEVDVVIWQTHFVLNVNPIPAWFWNYQNCINNAAVTWLGTTYPKGCLKLVNGRWGALSQEWGYYSWPIEYDIEFCRALTGDTTFGGWYYILPDRGYNKKTAAGKLAKILNDDGTTPQAARLLDGTGLPLANPTTAATVYNAWVCQDMVNFSILPAPPVPP